MTYFPGPKINALGLASIVALHAPLCAQSLVKDINQVAGPDPSSFVEESVTLGSTTFFVSRNQEFGTEVWTTDGTEAGTTILKDIAPGGPTGSTSAGSSYPQDLTTAGDRLFFSTRDTHQLWISDGAEAGTEFVAQLLSPSQFVPFGSSVVFVNQNSLTGTELWISDGTAGGTHVIKDIVPGLGSSSPLPFAELNGWLYFAARLPSDSAWKLWRTDGTDLGTSLFLDVDVTLSAAFLDYVHWAKACDRFYFAADDGLSGSEPWVTDGTLAGTYQLMDIVPGVGSSTPRDFTCAGGETFFHTDTLGPQLYATDGTAAGTRPVVDLPVHPDAPDHLTEFAGELAFTAATGAGNTQRALFLSDGTALGTRAIELPLGSGPAEPRELHSLGERLAFVAGDALIPDAEFLWATDGTPDTATALLTGATTVGLGRVFPGPAGTHALFAARPEVGPTEIYLTDGTESGTGQLIDLSPAPSESSNLTAITRFGDAVLFVAEDGVHGRELWISDGSDTGTRLVADVFPGSGSAIPPVSNALQPGAISGAGNEIYVLGEQAYFLADDGVHGPEPWVTDGTAGGTLMLADANPGHAGSAAARFLEFRGHVYFRAATGAPPTFHLWRSDGTPLGTEQFGDFTLGATNPRRGDILATEDTLYFTATSELVGIEPWTSDGTISGTQQLADIRPGPGESFVKGYTQLGSLVLFEARSTLSDAELWRTDGTTAGTELVLDIEPGFGPSEPAPFFPMGDGLVFAAKPLATGNELWFTDGTTVGTKPVVDLAPGPTFGIWTAYLRHESIVGVGDRAYFIGRDVSSASVRDLWVTDGSAAGTVHLKAFEEAGIQFSMLEPLVRVGGGEEIVFQASDGSSGVDLWTSDGTPQGTVLLADIAPGKGHSDPADFVRVGDKIYFGADAFDTGRELYTIDFETTGGWVAETFGAGCGDNSPSIGSDGSAVAGKTLDVTIEQAAPNSPALLYASLSPSPVVLDGCVVYASPVPVSLGTAFTDPSGSAGLALNVPSLPAWVGARLAFQYAVVDLAGPLFGVASLSNGLEAVVGAP